MLKLSPLKTEDNLNKVAGMGKGHESKYIYSDGLSLYGNKFLPRVVCDPKHPQLNRPSQIHEKIVTRSSSRRTAPNLTKVTNPK